MMQCPRQLFFTSSTYYIIVFLSISSELDPSWLGRVIGCDRIRATTGTWYMRREVVHVYIS